MFYKSFLYIVLILTVVITIVLCSIKPKMHTEIFIYNSDYQLTQVKTEKNEKQTTQTNTTPIRQEISTKKIIEKQKQQQKTKKETKQLPVVKTKAKDINISKQTIKIEKKVVKIPNKTVEANAQQIQSQIIKEEKAAEIEEIEWNKWRSNIQNQIMRDVKLPVLPNGTIFKFSFDVDKYGKITNIQTWSVTPTFTPYAVQYIAPVIRSYQGHSILDFPLGSQRISTAVTGQWKISTSQKYSTSSNFHDVESIQKGNQ